MSWRMQAFCVVQQLSSEQTQNEHPVPKQTVCCWLPLYSTHGTVANCSAVQQSCTKCTVVTAGCVCCWDSKWSHKVQPAVRQTQTVTQSAASQVAAVRQTQMASVCCRNKETGDVKCCGVATDCDSRGYHEAVGCVCVL